jgi:transcriptional regulator with XRE-family HTH domain
MTRFALLRQKILGLSQREIARKIGITQQSWAELEKQTREMKKKTTLEVLRCRFGVNPDWLLGKSHLLFSDWQKGLEVVKEKVQKSSRLSRWELLFLLEVMHYVYSNPLASKTSKETRSEFVPALVDSIKHLLRYEAKNIENLVSSTTLSALGLFGQDLFEALEAVQKLPAKIQLIRELTSVLISFLRDADFEISEDDERVLSEFLLPWSFYVAFAYNTIKQNLIPLSSVYFSFEELLKFEKKSDFEKLEFSFEKNKVYFEFSGDKLDILLKDKLKVSLDVSEAFPFLVLLTKSKEVDSFSVLGFSIRKDKLVKSIKFTFNQRIKVKLDKNEFDDLAELAEKVKEAKVKENGDLWLHLQRECLNRYGFV